MVTGKNLVLGTPLTESLLAAHGSAWPRLLGSASRDALIRGAAHVVRTMALPIWEQRSSNDRTPHRALEAAESCLRRQSEEARQHALILAKACTKARARTLGYTHRTAEAARGVARAAASKSPTELEQSLAEALGAVEDEVAYAYAVDAVHGKEREIRGRMIDALAESLRQDDENALKRGRSND
jgi:hypothetical protein